MSKKIMSTNTKPVPDSKNTRYIVETALSRAKKKLATVETRRAAVRVVKKHSDNPNHLEDFNTLLNRAALGGQKDDQT